MSWGKAGEQRRRRREGCWVGMSRNKRLLYAQASCTLPGHHRLWMHSSRDGTWSWTGQGSVETTQQCGAALLPTYPLSTTRKLGWAGLDSALPATPTLSATVHIACCNPASLGGGRNKARKGETESRTSLAIIVWDKEPPRKG